MTGPSMKGVTGWSFHKQRAAVAWKATNQTIVSLFSTEAELIAVDDATREVRFLHKLLLDFDIDVDMPTRIAQDNQSTIALVESKHFNARTKHVALRYHHTAEQQREGMLKVEYQPTDDMPADALTKALPQAAHQKHANVLLGRTPYKWTATNGKEPQPRLRDAGALRAVRRE